MCPDGMNNWCPLDVPSDKMNNLIMSIKELRGGSNNVSRNYLSMVAIAIQIAATHGINLQHGAPNRADGDCFF